MAPASGEKDRPLCVLGFLRSMETGTSPEMDSPESRFDPEDLEAIVVNQSMVELVCLKESGLIFLCVLQQRMSRNETRSDSEGE